MKSKFLPKLMFVLFVPALIVCQSKLKYEIVETITFTIDQFEITGNLYLPKDTEKYGVVIWVHGDGPDMRTNNFPGKDFFNTFLNNGYAYFRYDKPGSGDSKGEYDNYNLFEDRAKIVGAAIDKLSALKMIDTNKIGLAGSSQAGYVMPVVLKSRTDIAFMIGLSLPAMDSSEQWAYLLKMQMICEGHSKEKAEEFSEMHLKMIRSKTEEEFLSYVKYFEENPINISVLNGYDENFSKALKQWWPLDWAEKQSFNPMNIIAKTTIPVLSIYGEKDTQVDPNQGFESYKENLEAAGNKFFKVVILPNTDHNMSKSETGCLIEQRTRKKWETAPNLAEIVDDWLKELNEYFETKS